MAYEATRAAIKAAYKGSKKWSDKVDLMTNSQLVAVYFRLSNKGLIKHEPPKH